jgi:outer membrane protein assembly factor BamD
VGTKIIRTGSPPKAPRVRSWLVVVGALMMVGTTQCNNSDAKAPVGGLQYTTEAKRAYEKALEAFMDKDWEDARVLLVQVKSKYSYSKYARLAELRIADIDFEQEKFSSAITGYRTFSHDHRTDDSVPYARFRIAVSLYKQISDTVMLPSQEERDQSAIVDAYRELTSFLKDHPKTKWTREARFMLVGVTGRLVRHELYVARYYLNQDKFEPAANRIKYALRHFDGSGLEPEAMILLGETYLKMKKSKEASEVFQTCLAVYPESPFGEVAKRHLTAMGERPSGIIPPAKK